MKFKVLKDFSMGKVQAQRGSIIDIENTVKIQTLVRSRFLIQAEPDAVVTPIEEPAPAVESPKPSKKKSE